CAVGLSAFLISLKVIYDGTYYVAGMSMYPTLNVGGKCFSGEAEGNYFFTEQHGSLSFLPAEDGDLVDYGYSDGKPSTLNSLKRFDIVITYFTEDYDPETNSFTGSPKCKRIIGLPGETVTLLPDSSPMGKLLINGEVVEQPGNTFENYNAPLIKAGLSARYPASESPSNTARFETEGVTLGENEYYVCGDNRFGAFSSDSRTKGPVSFHCIQARVELRIGLCRIGDGTCKHEMDQWRMPWDWEQL
ncbi:MAG: signal peptidase I, partial [Bacilli bacterium]|nr:signal peptidase I [Bacilli bacterium]